MRRASLSELSDNLTYTYTPGTNRLAAIKENSSDTRGVAADAAFTYDARGNLIADGLSGRGVAWNHDGKVASVAGGTNPNGTSGELLAYRYDAQGNRLVKQLPSTANYSQFEVYARDANGNTLAKYNIQRDHEADGDGECYTIPKYRGLCENPIYYEPDGYKKLVRMYIREHQLYGTSRLGAIAENELVYVDVDLSYASLETNSSRLWGTRHRGRTTYELSNHLGNVLSSVSDMAQVYPNPDPLLPARRTATVRTATDYFPFGEKIDARTYVRGEAQSASDKAVHNEYHYGFNGKEDDLTWGGSSLIQDYGFRLYSPAMGRFLSTDPLSASYPMLTPYQFASNTPIVGVDLDGLELLTIHSADFTKQFMQGKPEMTSDADVLAAIDEMVARYGPDFGGYFNANSLRHAEQFYDSPGEVTSTSTPQVPLTVIGYSNAEDGTPFTYVLYQATTVTEPIIDVDPPSKPGMQNNLSGLQGALSTAVMDGTGFGKATRGLFNYMDGKDPYTGRHGSTSRLVTDGVIDIATMGLTPGQALYGIGSTAGAQGLQKLLPEYSTEVGIGKEALDIYGSGNVFEVGAHVIQGSIIIDNETKNDD